MAKKKKKNLYQKSSEQKETQEAVAMSPKAKRLMWLGGIVIFSTVLLTFYSAKYIAVPDIYYHFQKIIYGVMALGGGIIVLSSKYNEAKNRLNIQMVGLVFLMIGIGNFISLFLR